MVNTIKQFDFFYSLHTFYIALPNDQDRYIFIILLLRTLIWAPEVKNDPLNLFFRDISETLWTLPTNFVLSSSYPIMTVRSKNYILKCHPSPTIICVPRPQNQLKNNNFIYLDLSHVLSYMATKFQWVYHVFDVWQLSGTNCDLRQKYKTAAVKPEMVIDP